MSVYTDLRAALGPGSELEATFGFSATLTRTIPGVRNRATGKVALCEQVAIPCLAARATIKIKAEDGTVSKVAGYTLWTEPKAGDTLTFAGQSYRITDIVEFNPNGTAICWNVVAGSGS